MGVNAFQTSLSSTSVRPLPSPFFLSLTLMMMVGVEILEWIQIPRDDESLTIPRLSHTSTQVGSYLFVIGGHDGVNFSNEVLLFNLISLSWEIRSPSGLPPSYVPPSPLLSSLT